MTAETGSSSAGPEERSSRFPSWPVVLAAFLGAVVGVIAPRLGSSGFAVSFGFAERTVWNYLDVFLVPVAVAAATALLTLAQSRRQRRDEQAQEQRALAVENQRAQDEALQAYLDQMSQLLLDKSRPLRQSKEGEDVRTLARARTLTVLTRLDSARKGSVLRFLYETGLIIGEQPILSLSNADLREASLHAAEMSEINLDRTNLNQADFTGVNFHGAFLREVNLYSANLSGVDLSKANLRNADLSRVNLGFFEADEGAFYLSQLSEVIEPRSQAEKLQQDAPVQIEVHTDVGTLYRGSRIRGVVVESGDINVPYVHSVVVGSFRLQANLRDADLTNVDLREANLVDAVGVTNARLHQQAFSLKGATMPNGQKYEEWLKSRDREGVGENSGAS